MFTRVCCCDIKIAAMVLAILTTIETGGSILLLAFNVSFQGLM